MDNSRWRRGEEEEEELGLARMDQWEWAWEKVKSRPAILEAVAPASVGLVICPCPLVRAAGKNEDQGIGTYRSIASQT